MAHIFGGMRHDHATDDEENIHPGIAKIDDSSHPRCRIRKNTEYCTMKNYYPEGCHQPEYLYLFNHFTVLHGDVRTDA